MYSRGWKVSSPELSRGAAEAFAAYEKAGWAHGKAVPYSRFFLAVSNRFCDDLIAAAGVTPGARVLDVGCGPGNISGRLAALHALPCGVDLSKEMVDVAQEMNPGIEFRSADAESLPFADAEFDAVVGNFMLLHAARPEIVAKELVRVLRPGGGLALTVWDRPERSRFTGLFIDATQVGGAETTAELPAGPDALLYAEDARFSALMETVGLRDVVVQHVRHDAWFSSAAALWDGFMASSVRIAGNVNAQTREVQDRIRLAFERLAAELEVDGGIRVPAAAVLASGCKPSTHPF